MSDAEQDEVIGRAEAAELLEVELDRLEELVAEGSLAPVERAGEPAFWRSEVLALRLEGA